MPIVYKRWGTFPLQIVYMSWEEDKKKAEQINKKFDEG